MSDDSDREELGQRALQVLRRRTGMIFKELELRFDETSGEIPDEDTFVIPVLLTAIVHSGKNGYELVGTSIAAPRGLEEHGIEAVISECLNQLRETVCEVMTVLEDGSSLAKKDIQ